MNSRRTIHSYLLHLLARSLKVAKADREVAVRTTCYAGPLVQVMLVVAHGAFYPATATLVAVTPLTGARRILITVVVNTPSFIKSVASTGKTVWARFVARAGMQVRVVSAKATRTAIVGALVAVTFLGNARSGAGAAERTRACRRQAANLALFSRDALAVQQVLTVLALQA